MSQDFVGQAAVVTGSTSGIGRASPSSSHSSWRTAMLLPVTLQNSHQNGGRDFLIFVADPRTARLCRSGLSCQRAA